MVRYKRVFGSVNYEVNVGNHSLVVLNTLALSSRVPSIRDESQKLLNHIKLAVSYLGPATSLGLMVPERQHRSESKSESESEFESDSESGSLLVSSRNDLLGYDMWWQERQNEMWLRLDVDFILAGCEDAVVITARGTVDGDADIDGYVEYERNLIDSALELLASSQAVPLQLQLADGRDGDGAPRIDSDK
ncbi:hypothetical protein BKA57DRAFT_441148 [Linnemannia elongata]|nr:hypothetical protein BKA57DRAFT_441148 [Linnemannia elongata]